MRVVITFTEDEARHAKNIAAFIRDITGGKCKCVQLNRHSRFQVHYIVSR